MAVTVYPKARKRCQIGTVRASTQSGATLRQGIGLKREQIMRVFNVTASVKAGALMLTSLVLMSCCPGPLCRPAPAPTPNPVDLQPILKKRIVEGFADFHNHEFAYLGFGGTGISHTVDPTTPCVPLLTYHNSSFHVVDLVRRGLFGQASSEWSSGLCFPAIGNAASQRVDTDNLKRAWQAGLRLIVVFAVSSEFLCETAQLAIPCPSDRSAVDAQIKAAHDLEAMIDAAAGGRGMGWYRIVTTPAEARYAIAKGKLAVVLGIEAANAFGCRIRQQSSVPGVGTPFEGGFSEPTYFQDCSDGTIRPEDFYSYSGTSGDFPSYGSEHTHRALALLDHYWSEGVRDFFLTHNIDGIASGTALSIDLLH